MEDMKGNVLGPALVAKAFRPLLERSASNVPSGSPDQPPVVSNMSSDLGSIGLNRYGAMDALYSISKAAVNMLVSFVPLTILRGCTYFVLQTYKQAAERPDIIWICVHPGWVKTGASSIKLQLLAF
jgi:NAD(P)-dependent dehydrogenase (short-subunit alcohol dehydrogenase family)